MSQRSLEHFPPNSCPGEKAAALAKKAKELPSPSRRLTMDDVPRLGSLGDEKDDTGNIWKIMYVCTVYYCIVLYCIVVNFNVT